MSATIHEFKADLAGFAEKIDRDLGTVVQALAGQLFKDVVKETPVDTGRARAGWALTTGAPSDFVPEALVSSPEQVRSGIKPKHPLPPEPDTSKINGTEKVFIVNNVHYAQYLEEGSSQQAPAGMVRVAMTMAEIRMEQILARIE